MTRQEALKNEEQLALELGERDMRFGLISDPWRTMKV
jgi:hypothetical protein